MPSAESAPVSDGEAAKLFAPLRDRAGLALAVSGGSDSSALLVLYARARAVDPRLPPATVFTVDHRLRPEAAEEARIVAALAVRHGLPHRTLVWEGEKPAGDLQANARRARYDLLLDAARALGLDALVTAHHAEDQAETFLARLARGSGVIGLAAMRPHRLVDGIRLARPFLDLPKARLIATLEAIGETWIEDPSNRDRRFDRTRLRAAAPFLADLGLTRDRLVATARAMARAAEAIESEVDAALAAVATHPAGWASFDPAEVGGRPEEVRLRLLSRLLRAVGGADYGPRWQALEPLAAALFDRPEADFAARTLAGARLERRAGRVWIAAERGRDGGPTTSLAPGARGRFRGRRIELAVEAPSPVTVAALAAEGRRSIAARLDPERLGRWKPTAAMVESAPAVFVEGGLVACPVLGYEGDARRRWGDLLRLAPWSV